MPKHQYVKEPGASFAANDLVFALWEKDSYYPARIRTVLKATQSSMTMGDEFQYECLFVDPASKNFTRLFKAQDLLSVDALNPGIEIGVANHGKTYTKAQLVDIEKIDKENSDEEVADGYNFKVVIVPQNKKTSKNSIASPEKLVKYASSCCSLFASIYIEILYL